MAGNRPPTSLVPTSFIVLVNMFTEADYLNDPSFFADLKEDVTGKLFTSMLLSLIITFNR